MQVDITNNTQVDTETNDTINTPEGTDLYGHDFSTIY